MTVFKRSLDCGNDVLRSLSRSFLDFVDLTTDGAGVDIG